MRTNSSFAWIALVALGVLQNGLSAQMQSRITEIYPAASPNRVSPNWTLEVHDGANWVSAPVCTHVASPYPGWPNPGQAGWVNNLGSNPIRVSWTTLGLSHSARIRVKSLVATTATLTVLPDRVDPAAIATPGCVEFTVVAGRKYFVKRNSHPNYEDTMFVFANPPERRDTATGTPLGTLWANPLTRPADVEFFGPGEHTISSVSANGDLNTLDVNNSGKRRIYLAPGAWVKGHLDVGLLGSTAADQIEVLGPGVLSGENDSHDLVRSDPGFPTQLCMITSAWWDYSQPPQNGMNNSVVVDGPTIVAAPMFHFLLTHIRGKKTIANTHLLTPWNYNSDGFQVGNNASIENCFVFNNDDILLGEYVFLSYPYLQVGGSWSAQYKDISVKNCVFAGRAVFQMGYGYFGPTGSGHWGHYTTVESCDVAFMLPAGWDPHEGVFAASVANWSPLVGGLPTIPNEVGNQIYRDIRIHGPVRRLFNMEIAVPSWAAPGSASQFGNFRNVVFENVKVVDPHALGGSGMLLSIFRGKDAQNMMGYVEFRDIVVNRAGIGFEKIAGGTSIGNWWNYFESPPNWNAVSWNFR